MKQMISTALALAAALALLSGCTGKPATTQPSAGQSQPGQNAPTSQENEAGVSLKTGFSMTASVAGSRDASADEDGCAQTDVTLVAVTVGDDGVIEDCVIDGIRANIRFNTAGELTTSPATIFESKNELGDAYGMLMGSSIGREWYEQAAAMAGYAVGKTVEQLKGIAVNEKGAPSEADLVSSVTLSIGEFVSGIESAVNHAQHLGAKRGDRLTLSTTTNMTKSMDASAEGDGLAQAYTTAAAVTFDGETITSCYLDAVQADVKFNGRGVITTDLSVAQPTKNQLGDTYGMKAASSIGKEWYEQAAAFSAYVTGKTAQQVATIAVDEYDRPDQADLAASVTLGIGDFQALIEKAAR